MTCVTIEGVDKRRRPLCLKELLADGLSVHPASWMGSLWESLWSAGGHVQWVWAVRTTDCERQVWALRTAHCKGPQTYLCLKLLDWSHRYNRKVKKNSCRTPECTMYNAALWTFRMHKLSGHLTVQVLPANRHTHYWGMCTLGSGLMCVSVCAGETDSNFPNVCTYRHNFLSYNSPTVSLVWYFL